jgi:hypothetical protein
MARSIDNGITSAVALSVTTLPWYILLSAGVGAIGPTPFDCPLIEPEELLEDEPDEELEELCASAKATEMQPAISNVAANRIDPSRFLEKQSRVKPIPIYADDT